MMHIPLMGVIGVQRNSPLAQRIMLVAECDSYVVHDSRLHRRSVADLTLEGRRVVNAVLDCFAARVSQQRKKIDVSEHPAVFDHVGLLVNRPTGTAGLPFN
jgi:hypothetical protein